MTALRSWFLGLVALAALSGSGAATAAPLFVSGAGDATDALANNVNGVYTSAVVYNGFTVTNAGGWHVTGLFTNNFTDFAATTASWSIRSGVSAGNAGTLVASGTGATVAPSGNPTPVALAGLTERTFTVSGLNVNLAPGNYWFSVTPDGAGTGYSAQSNTSGLGAVGTAVSSFFTSSDLSLNFVTTTSQGAQFGRLSGGVVGDVITPGAAVPEPATLLVFGLGAGCFALVGRRARRKAAEAV